MTRYRKKHIPWNKGVKWSPRIRKIMLAGHRTKEYRKKMSEMRSGFKNPMYGRTQEKSPYWKGDEVSYAGLHHWVLKYKMKPDSCSNCGRSNCVIDWANRDGKYRRVLSDWIALCRKCHRKHDKNNESGKLSFIQKNHAQHQ